MKDSKTTSMRDRVRKRAETRRNLGGLDTLTLPDGVEFYKPEKGTEEFDILPYRVSVDTHPEVKKGELWYERTYLAHRNVGPDEQFLVCPRTIGKRCPICEEHQRLKKDPDVEEEVVEALRPKERELFNVVLKDGKGEVQVLDISTFLFGRMLEEEIRNGDVDVAGFAELKGGKTLKVRWSERSMGKQKFVEANRIDFLDRDDFDADTLDAVVDLDAALKILTYEEIDKIFQAGSAEDDEGKGTTEEEEGAEEEEKPARRVVGKKSVAKKDEPEEEEEEEEEAEPEEEELPGMKEKKAESSKADCIACDGTGKTTKGKACPICGGSGKDEDVPVEKEEPAEEEQDAEEEVKPAKRVIGKPTAKEEAPAGRRVIRRG